MKLRAKNRSRESERLERNQLLPLNYRYSDRKKGVHVAAAIKIPRASNRTRHLWPPFCLLFRARARLKKPGYKQNHQPIRQKSPLLLQCQMEYCPWTSSKLEPVIWLRVLVTLAYMKGRTDVRTLYVRTDVHDVMAIKPNFRTSMGYQGYHIFLIYGAIRHTSLGI